jgi:hypothetical protein
MEELTSGSVALRELLPTGTSLPDDFELVASEAGIEPRFSRNGFDVVAPGDGAIRGCSFGLPDHPAPDSNQVDCEIILPPEEDRSAEHIESHHASVRRKIPSGGLDDKEVTEWVTVESTQTTVDNHLRTIDWVRTPVLDNHPAVSDISKPTCERAVVIESTSWGLITITADRVPASDRQARDNALALLEETRQQIRNAPEPTSVPYAPLPLDWDDLPERMRGRVTAEVIEANASAGLDTDAIVAAVATQYDAPPAAVDEHIAWSNVRNRGELVTRLLCWSAPDGTVDGGDPSIVADRAAQRLGAPRDVVEDLAHDLQGPGHEGEQHCRMGKRRGSR